MNYLAHGYLSYNYPEIVVGNMVSDFVKGAAKLGFSGKIQKGITLHRDIDAFTDSHPETKKAKEIFRPHYRLYSGAIMDVLYDHFLANDETIFTEDSLKEFSQGIYKHLEMYTAELPDRFVHVFSYMQSQDWLYHYRTKEGIRNSLSGLVRRAAYLSESQTAYNLFLEHYDFLNDCYRPFFKDVKLFAKHRLEELLA
jgi:acyl carrier protein phosphodiesterase